MEGIKINTDKHSEMEAHYKCSQFYHVVENNMTLVVILSPILVSDLSQVTNDLGPNNTRVVTLTFQKINIPQITKSKSLLTQ
jgi:hypothetical protein